MKRRNFLKSLVGILAIVIARKLPKLPEVPEEHELPVEHVHNASAPYAGSSVWVYSSGDKSFIPYDESYKSPKKTGFEDIPYPYSDDVAMG